MGRFLCFLAITEIPTKIIDGKPQIRNQHPKKHEEAKNYNSSRIGFKKNYLTTELLESSGEKRKMRKSRQARAGENAAQINAISSGERIAFLPLRFAYCSNFGFPGEAKLAAALVYLSLNS
ncbi:hypothetical protein AVEN_24025-1 [Araneus ventricosus]|uniref:Uncharacterized protein n=1 Tax=Araneus ventricosus TaxID=182803 RepID=A0A4Y2RV06_ARAVE|nr:hypothetical protein AVEN_167882-1 [Araneus ventricosus]GBN79747.1 hypothetical protein AVEN_24025-1 [Araneus ventricosus]